MLSHVGAVPIVAAPHTRVNELEQMSPPLSTLIDFAFQPALFPFAMAQDLCRPFLAR